MDENLQNRLEATGVELLDWMKDAAEKGGDFVAEQAPLLAQEIVAWHFWSSIGGCVLGVALAALCAVVAFIMFRVAASFGDEYSDIEPKFAAWMIGVVASILSPVLLFLIVGFNGYEAVKAAVAPRIVLIEYAGKALGGK